MSDTLSAGKNVTGLFQDRRFFILGATSGLATSVLPWLVGEGASLVLHSRSEEKLFSLVRQLALPEERCATVVGDITDAELFGKLWEAGSLSAIPFGFLCFVGIPGRLVADDWTPEALAAIFAVNCSGPLLACRTWAQMMEKEGLSGNAVCLSTMQACYPFEKSLPYSLGKIALQGGVEILAKEFGARLRINALAPGVNEAGMALASIQRGKYQPYLDDGRIERYGSPEDIRAAISFLVQPHLYMTGQTILLDGGLTLRRDLRL